MVNGKQNDRPTEENGSWQNEFPFKSYDEIQAARKRAGMYRKGFIIATLVIVALLLISVTLGLFSGNFIARKMMNMLGSGDEEVVKEAENGQKADGGFSIKIEGNDGKGDVLITTYDVSGVVERAGKSVVGIATESYSSFTTGSSGSGIIASADGYIVTNYHVIEGGDNITVILSDGTNSPAYLIGADEMSDIAVLKIPAEGLEAAVFGDSQSLTVGEPAIAIGSPGGIELQGTVTAGIISATDREITVGNNVMKLIQTDASINPGNSGGPLLNKYGQVVGVTSVKITASGYEGLGFAIPIDYVKPIVEELVENGYVSGRPLVGVSVRVVSQLAATFYGLPRGLLVDAVAPNSSVAKAGLQPGDIITHFNGSPVRNISDACTIRNQFKSGEVIGLSYYRNGAVYDVEFELDEQQGADSGYDF